MIYEHTPLNGNCRLLVPSSASFSVPLSLHSGSGPFLSRGKRRGLWGTRRGRGRPNCFCSDSSIKWRNGGPKPNEGRAEPPMAGRGRTKSFMGYCGVFGRLRVTYHRLGTDLHSHGWAKEVACIPPPDSLWLRGRVHPT